MKDKIIVLFIIPLVFVFGFLQIIAGTGKIYIVDGFDSLDGQLRTVEDVLLIDSLEMSSSEKPANTDLNSGAIIYDDHFLDSDEVEAIKKISIEKTLNSKDKILKELQKKDYRWHISEHKIKKGENIWTIARSYGVSHKIIISYNNIEDPDRIRPGKKLDIPNKRGIEYEVKSGDTLSQIALDYKVSLNVAKQYNQNREQIKIGQILFLPDAVTVVKEPVSNDTGKIALKKDDKSNKNGKTVVSGHDGIVFGWPLHGDITSHFGMRVHPISGNRQFHNGIDIRADIATAVRSSEKGRVIFCGWKDGYGKMIVVKHDNNYLTVYAHLSDYLIKKNDKVKKGQKLGLSGNTGLSTGPHLHFEIRKYETPLNPVRMIK
ncbi:MAG: M23 family metallopeptidase [Spirochaetes bacterium]|nr:M23 family metallopeptidase [Spirochaetota bacterium]MBN2770812.1 M23 family metallopeptidase [Spirochaetota bacterium]